MTTEQVFHLIEMLGSLAWIVIGLLIKNSLSVVKLTQAQDKAELLDHQNRIKEEVVLGQNNIRNELQTQNNVLSQGLAVHIAEDNLRFKQLEKQNNVQVNVQK